MKSSHIVCVCASAYGIKKKRVLKFDMECVGSISRVLFHRLRKTRQFSKMHSSFSLNKAFTPYNSDSECIQDFDDVKIVLRVVSLLLFLEISKEEFRTVHEPRSLKEFLVVIFCAISFLHYHHNGLLIRLQNMSELY